MKRSSLPEPWKAVDNTAMLAEISAPSGRLARVPALVQRRARGAPKLATAPVQRLAEAMLSMVELEHAELSVLLTNDAGIHELNRVHRGKDRPTDVLAFPLELETRLPAQPLLGDVVISLDTAQRQADSRRRPLLAEVRFLLAHGLLHLIGFDHDTKARKRKMDAMARKLVKGAPLPADVKSGRAWTQGVGKRPGSMPRQR